MGVNSLATCDFCGEDCGVGDGKSPTFLKFSMTVGSVFWPRNGAMCVKCAKVWQMKGCKITVGKHSHVLPPMSD